MLCRVRVLRRVPGVEGMIEKEDEGVMAEDVRVAGISDKMDRSEVGIFLSASGLSVWSIWAWQRRSRRVGVGLLEGGEAGQSQLEPGRPRSPQDCRKQGRTHMVSADSFSDRN